MGRLFSEPYASASAQNTRTQDVYSADDDEDYEDYEEYEDDEEFDVEGEEEDDDGTCEA